MHVYICRSTCICMYAWYLCIHVLYVCACMYVYMYMYIYQIVTTWYSSSKTHGHTHNACSKTAKLFPPIPRQNLTTDANLKEVGQMRQHPQLDIVKVLCGVLVERGHQLGNSLVSAKDTGQFMERVGQHTTYLPLEMRRGMRVSATWQEKEPPKLPLNF